MSQILVVFVTLLGGIFAPSLTSACVIDAGLGIDTSCKTTSGGSTPLPVIEICNSYETFKSKNPLLCLFAEEDDELEISANVACVYREVQVGESICGLADIPEFPYREDVNWPNGAEPAIQLNDERTLDAGSARRYLRDKRNENNHFNDLWRAIDDLRDVFFDFSIAYTVREICQRIINESIDHRDEYSDRALCAPFATELEEEFGDRVLKRTEADSVKKFSLTAVRFSYNNDSEVRSNHVDTFQQNLRDKLQEARELLSESKDYLLEPEEYQLTVNFSSVIARRNINESSGVASERYRNLMSQLDLESMADELDFKMIGQLEPSYPTPSRCRRTETDYNACPTTPTPWTPVVVGGVDKCYHCYGRVETFGSNGIRCVGGRYNDWTPSDIPGRRYQFHFPADRTETVTDHSCLSRERSLAFENIEVGFEIR